MSAEARELHRIIRASVRDMLDAYRIQAQAGPVSEQALEAIIFRAAHPIVDSLAPYPATERAALLPSVVRLMLASFLEDVADVDGTEEGKGYSFSMVSSHTSGTGGSGNACRFRRARSGGACRPSRKAGRACIKGWRGRRIVTQS